MAIDHMVLILYYLQNFYYNEVLRGLCGLGNFRVKSQCKVFQKNPSDTVFPYMYNNPENVVEAVMEAKVSTPEAQKASIDRECRSQLSLAKMVIKNKKIICVAERSVFLVEGTKGDFYSVTLFPKEKCPCLSKGTCYHIIACRIAIGLPPGTKSKQHVNLTTLKRNKRNKLKSGRKKPRIDDIDVTRAPDSIAATMEMTGEEAWFRNMDDISPPSSPYIQSVDFLDAMSSPKGASKPVPTDMTCDAHEDPRQDNLPSFSTPGMSSTPVHTESICDENEQISETKSINEGPWKSCSFVLERVERGANIVCRVGPFLVNNTDLASLLPRSWLTESVILAFLEKCTASQRQSAVTFLVADSHAFSAWERGDTRFVTQWALANHVFQSDVWLCPVLVRSSHWILLVVIRKWRQLIILDSMRGNNNACSTSFLTMYQALLRITYGKSFSVSDPWCIYEPHDIPHQWNGYDCGVFVCAAGHSIISGSYGNY